MTDTIKDSASIFIFLALWALVFVVLPCACDICVGGY